MALRVLPTPPTILDLAAEALAFGLFALHQVALRASSMPLVILDLVAKALAFGLLALILDLAAKVLSSSLRVNCSFGSIPMTKIVLLVH